MGMAISVARDWVDWGWGGACGFGTLHGDVLSDRKSPRLCA
jgi:hypothetical protein